MRVISGLIKGLKLRFLKETSVRPTSEKVKEAIFDSIQFIVEGKVFLDLFAGCGQMGIEAVSRGAKKAYLVDFYKDSICTIKSNISRFREDFFKKVFIINKDVFSFLKSNTEIFDIVFMDPPYKKGIIPKVLNDLSDFVASDGIVICEHEKSEVLPETVKDLRIFKIKSYGKTSVSFYKKCKVYA